MKTPDKDLVELNEDDLIGVSGGLSYEAELKPKE